MGFEEKDSDNINTPTFVGFDSLGVGAPVGRINIFGIYSTFFRKEQPSVNRALPPVGVQRTDPHPAQYTCVWAWLKTVVIWKQPGHFTSMKKEFGDCTSRFSLCFCSSK